MRIYFSTSEYDRIFHAYGLNIPVTHYLARDIEAGEELFLSYGDNYWKAVQNDPDHCSKTPVSEEGVNVNVAQRSDNSTNANRVSSQEVTAGTEDGAMQSS